MIIPDYLKAATPYSLVLKTGMFIIIICRFLGSLLYIISLLDTRRLENFLVGGLLGYCVVVK